jgi:membrane-associated phospholipid phosphatase
MLKKSFTLYFLFLFFQIHLFPQITNDIKSDINHFGNSGKGLWNSFTRFDSETNITLATSFLLISSAYLADEQVKNYSQSNKSKFGDNLFSIDDYYGSEWTLIAIGAAYGFGLLSREEGFRKTARTAAEAAIYSGLVTSIIKSVFGRSRPYVDKGKSDFHPINFTAPETAFPSGHTTLSFAISTALAEQTESIPLKIGLFSAAVLVGAARIYNNAHWFSDVIGGGLIGYFIGKHVGKNGSSEKENISLVPSNNNLVSIIILL